MSVSYEDALFHQLMLQSGITDLFPDWLNAQLEQENPLSDLTLELSFCGSDLSNIISCLHKYTLEPPINQETVAGMVREELKKRYLCGNMSTETCAKTLSAIARSDKLTGDTWRAMEIMGYDLDDYEDGYLMRESFESRLLACLENRPLPEADLRFVFPEPGRLQKLRQLIKHIFKGRKQV